MSLVCSLAAVASLHTIAHAQWLPDRVYTEGPGFRVGDLEIHPGVAARAGYDSNNFRSEKGREVDGATLAVTPHINISTLSRQRLTQGEDASGARAVPISRPLAFKLGFSTTFFRMFVPNAPTNVEFDTDAALSLRPDGPVGFDIGGAYQRTIRPFSEFTGRAANNEYARNRIAPIARLRTQSRSGVLRADIAYAPEVIRYESATFNYLNSYSHGIRTSTAWRFLPYTALVGDANLAFTDFWDPFKQNAEVLLSPSKRFQARLGLNGNITRSVSLRVIAGYAFENFDNAEFDDYEDVIGEAVLGFGWGPHKVELGYHRMVIPASLGGWMRSDRGLIKASFLLAHSFALTIEGGAGTAHYGRIIGPPASPGAPAPILGVNRNTGEPIERREDIRIDGAVHGEYRVTNWLALMADFAAFASLTDFEYVGGVNARPDPAQFVAYQIFGGVRLHY